MQNSPLTTQQIQIKSTAYPVVSEPKVGEPEAWTKVAEAGAGDQVEVVPVQGVDPMDWVLVSRPTTK